MGQLRTADAALDHLAVMKASLSEHAEALSLGALP